MKSLRTFQHCIAIIAVPNLHQAQNSARNAAPKLRKLRKCSAHSVEMKLCRVQNSAQSAEQDACNRYKIEVERN